jgi:hypothetical protein
MNPILCPRCSRPNLEPRLIACIPCLITADPEALALFVAARGELRAWLEPRLAWLETAERDERWYRARAKVDERLGSYLGICQRLKDAAPERVEAAA